MPLLEETVRKQLINNPPLLLLPPLQFTVKDVDPVLEGRSGERLRPDLVVEVEWAGNRKKFVAELTRLSTPKAVEAALQQARRYAAASAGASSAKCLPMIVAPYLGPQALERLTTENVSGIDLSGNGVVTVPGEWFVLRTGAENKYRSSLPIKNVFRGASSLAARVFLSKPVFASVTEVVEEITSRGGRINFSTVSKVLKTLEEELIIGREDEIKLADDARLLGLLVENYRKPDVRRRLRGRWKSESWKNKVLPTLGANTERAGITVAGDEPSRYVLMPSEGEVTTIYTTSISKLLEDVEFEETNRFSDFEMLETDDQTVYFDRRAEGSFYWTSPLQVYLELAAGGKRERETAAQLREDILRFRFSDRGGQR